MLKGISLKDRVEFSCSFDTDEPKTVFVLRPLSGVEMLEISQYLGSMGPNGSEVDTSFIVTTLKKPIVEIKNFNDDPLDKQIEALDMRTIRELSDKIEEINRITVEEEKN